jgi:hypothetical protein
MQPTFSIEPNRLLRHYGALRELGFASAESDPFTRAALFLTGLHYAFSYFIRSQQGIGSERYPAPNHPLDDGLYLAATLAARALHTRAHSREISDDIASFKAIQGKPPPNEPWQRLVFAWIGMDNHIPRKVQMWLAYQCEDERWLRLAIGMGVVSLFGVPDSLHARDVMKHPIPPINPALGEDANRIAIGLIASFKRDSSLDLPEL